MRHDYFEFNSVLYPINLMIAWGGDNKWSSEDFKDIEFAEGNAAMTYYCYHVPSSRMCVLIRFFDKSYMTDYFTVAHEAFHATLFILDHIGSSVNVDFQEHGAYLAGWVANCINLVRKKEQLTIKLQEIHG